MSKVHRTVRSAIAGPLRAVFLDTPAGFELNVDQISARAVAYFAERLGAELTVASFKAAAAATPAQVAAVLRKLRQANYIFAGPGSPTYTVRNWQGTAVLEALQRRLAAGAHLVFASAAAIAMGRYALPVYEIYKVGEEPRWVEGLNLFGRYGLELAIVPHWNNTEGGSYDTRYCFIGEPRMRILEAQLPGSATVLGIDEYTACRIDLGSGECRVLGAGQVTLCQGGRERAYPAPAVFGLDRLRATAPLAGVYPALADAPRSSDFVWPDLPEDDEASVAPFIDLLVDIRAQLRAGQHWELADEIRRRLAALGVALDDGPEETTWRRA